MKKKESPIPAWQEEMRKREAGEVRSITMMLIGAFAALSSVSLVLWLMTSVETDKLAVALGDSTNNFPAQVEEVVTRSNEPVWLEGRADISFPGSQTTNQ